MSLPLTLQLFNAFLGEQQGANVLLLPDAFSSGGSKNVWIDKLGRVRKISGRTRINTSSYPLSSGLYNDTGHVQGIFQGHFTSGTLPGEDMTKRLIWLVHGFAAGLFTSTDGGVTATAAATSLFPNAQDVPDFAQYGQTVYMTSRAFGNYTWDGTTAAALTVTQSPTVTSTEGSAGKLNGTYQWKLVSIHGTTGARKAGSVASTRLTMTDKQGSLTWTADADTNQGGYELYRTTGTGNLFYFVTYIDGRTTAAYTDNTPDTDIFQNRVMEEHGDAPPASAYFVETHKGRVWWGGTATYPDRLWWSDAGLPTSVYADNYINFSDAEIQGDRLTGMLGSFNDALVVFTERAVWTVSGTGAVIGRIADWNRQRSNARTGAVSSRAAVRVHAGARYLEATGEPTTTARAGIAYWTPLGDIRLFDGLNDTVISTPIKDTLATWSYAYRHLIHAVHDPDNNQIIWFYPTTDNGSTGTYCDKAIVWNYQWGAWYVWDGQATRASILMDSSTDPAIIISGQGDYDGQHLLWTVNSGDSFDGEAIDARWMTKPLYGMDENGVPILSSRKRWRWIDLRMSEVDPDATIVVEWLDGGAGPLDPAISSGSVQPAIGTLVSSDGDTIVDASALTIYTAAPVLHAKVRFEDSTGDYPHTEGLRLRISESSTTGGWAIDGFTLASQLLPGQKRRMDE